MRNAVKFTFDTSFDDGAQDLARTEARQRKNYSVDEIEQIRREAREEGRRDSDVRATQAVAASIGQVAAAVLSAIQAMDGEIEAIRAEAAQLAVTASKKLARAALAAAPESEIAEALQIALHQAIGEPRVVVKTSPLLVQKIQERANEIASTEGFDGRMQFIGDHTLMNADCRIEWRGGGIERAQATLEKALDGLVAQRFACAPLQENE
ncbi:MAG TPA: FliH/SctL family protein [Micropepsaceae bacterium]|jgi:flagellar assembly protein FliH|nr:FliH/SctL family protein [Micropepsaceae bacterium]